MSKILKKIIKKIFNYFNLSINKKSKLDKTLSESINYKKWENDIKFTQKFSKRYEYDFLELVKLSKSQTKQDLFAISELNFKKNGFFVDIGASDGFTLSNTYLLEKFFNFNGILAEPNPHQIKKIRKIREAKFVEKCVWSKSNEKLEFIDAGDLSTIDQFYDQDKWSYMRENKPKFTVDTISLLDLLSQNNAPKMIDYLSIDTEGSEYEILSNHDFSKFSFSIITVEHNYTSQREKIFNLLTSKGYKRKYEEFSNQDDWYTLY